MESIFIITSPNAQFTEMAHSVFEEFKLTTVIIEDVLEPAVDIILETSRKHDVSAIISRGGTAAMIREKLKIPVLVAEANDFDILTAFLAAMEVSSEIAYVLSADGSVDDLAQVALRLNIKMKPYFFHNMAELSLAISQAKKDGCQVVVSGSDMAKNICHAHNLPCFVVNTSRRTMVEMMQRALLIREVRNREIEHNQQLTTIFNLVPESVFYLNAHDCIAMVNQRGLQLLKPENSQSTIGANLKTIDQNLYDIITKRQASTGMVVNIFGKTMLLHSAPVFIQTTYLGTVLTLQRASEVEKLEHRVRRQVHSSGLVAETYFQKIENLTKSPIMLVSLNRAKGYANTNGTILITGESGTGKELMAQSIHNHSPRQNRAFVPINCAALPLTLLESELFGYEEGSFTGAKRGGKPGYFELAHEGTLFLDELGLLPLHVQMQLLRVLQSKQVLRIGGRKMIPVDVRVVAATNADLYQAVADGTFRQDLYYRINVLQIDIPPLRKRLEDIAPIAAHYLPIFSRENNKNIKALSPELLAIFQKHHWPGNVRELINYLMRLAVSASGPVLTIDDFNEAEINLHPQGQSEEPPPPPNLNLNEINHHHLNEQEEL
ncbi:MAG: sigma 54-interacting transcriptional regulator, partial [Candidatus Adiutrix sp.]